jgi:hypothetical protein
MKIQSNSKHTAGLTTVLPHVGEVTFSEKNTIEVDDQLGQELLKTDCGLQLEEIVKKGGKQENEEELTEEENEKLEKLKTLSDEEIEGLLADYPKNKTKNLKDRDSKIAFLLPLI